MAQISGVRKKIATLLATWQDGHLIRNGVLVVISGKPNVGKSTLLNALLGKQRAIVTDIPGTTRDFIEETCVLNGFLMRLVDTAGLRKSDCRIEREGVQLTMELREKADVHIYMLDGSSPLGDDDLSNMSDLDVARTLIVINKSDLGVRTDPSMLSPFNCVTTSLTGSLGARPVRSSLERLISARQCDHSGAMISERHRHILTSCDHELAQAVQVIESHSPDFVIAASKMKSVIDTLGQATGRVYHEELLNSIFSRFCIGK